MNSMIHNTSWVTAHFHLIFGGAVVIMYFAIAYEMWPRITGKTAALKEVGAPPTLAVVLGNNDRHHSLAHHPADGTTAAGRSI
jgi:heme/copper-type cytochrome/quinol oxidase subunit 1